MAGLHFDDPSPEDTTGLLTINSIVMHNGAWDVLDCTPLWTPGAVRGKDILVPNQAGRVPVPRRVDETKFSMPMAFSGEVDSTGTPYAEWWRGLYANVAALTTALGIPATGSVVAQLLVPDPTGTFDATHSLLVNDAVVETIKLGKVANGATPFMRASLEVIFTGPWLPSP